MGGTRSPRAPRYRSGGTIRFLAHSISEASSRRATNLWGIGSALARLEITGAFASRIPGRGSPVCAVHIRESCPSAAAWNVRASTPRTPSRASRAFSSPAAFSVKVTARIASAGNAPEAT